MTPKAELFLVEESLVSDHGVSFQPKGDVGQMA
jgi:hypothetical protein